MVVAPVTDVKLCFRVCFVVSRSTTRTRAARSKRLSYRARAGLLPCRSPVRPCCRTYFPEAGGAVAVEGVWAGAGAFSAYSEAPPLILSRMEAETVRLGTWPTGHRPS